MSRATAKVFESGRSQAVRIPKDFRFDCEEVLVERDGPRLVLTPKPRRLKEFFANPRFARLSASFPGDIEDAPPAPVEPL